MRAAGTRRDDSQSAPSSPPARRPHRRPRVGGDPAHSHGSRGKSTGHSHQHGSTGDTDRRYLLIALGLLVAFMVVEVVVAVTSGSLALLSDAGHMLSDVGALAASLWAIHLAARPAAGAWTFG